MNNPFPMPFCRLSLKHFLRVGLVLCFLLSSAEAQDVDKVGSAALESIKSFSSVFVPLLAGGAALTLIIAVASWLLSIIIGSQE